MVRKLTDYLLKEFQKGGLVVPFGTAYRIAEDLIVKQNECSKELVLCQECKHCRLPWLEGQEMGRCMLGRTMIVELDHFCSYGERRTGNEH